MAKLPTIYTIQAFDASQHTGKLQEILQKLKTENRIDGFMVLGLQDEFSSLTDKMEDDDLLLIVLTQEIETKKEQIESRFRAFKANHPNVRIAEILVDNVVYDNTFITFPDDLRPIRDRNDMDTAWSGIEQRLKELFPLQPVSAQGSVTPIDWLKYLKIAGIVAGLLLAYFIIKGLMDRDDAPPLRDTDGYGVVEPVQRPVD